MTAMSKPDRRISRSAAVLLTLVLFAGLLTACTLPSMPGIGGEKGTVDEPPAGATGSGVPLPQPYDYPPEDGIVRNAGFERGLEGWEVWDQKPTRSPGDNVIETADWAERNGKVLHVTRTSERDAGASGVIQKLSYDCSGAKSLWVTYKGYINFEQGGNIANRDPRSFPEGGAQVRLKYLDADGTEHEWYHGLYITQTAGADTANFMQIGDNNWTHYVSPDLMRLDPKPVRLTEVRFYGFGWGFDAMMDDRQIVTEK
jgi:hypothetical protein